MYLCTKYDKEKNMKSLKKVMMYFLSLSFIALFGVWFCKSKSCGSLHECLLSYNLFSIFKGNKEFIVSILVDISLTSFFTAIGFFISYMEKVKKRQEELKRFYIIIRNRCFDRIFYEQNSYDEDYEEVASIFDYLTKYRSDVLEYRPILLVFKVKIFNLIYKAKKVLLKKNNEKAFISIFNYVKEDKYALICSCFSDIYRYFYLLHMYQTSITESKKVILLYEKKVKEIGEDSAWSKLLEAEKRNLEVKKNRLVSRFPYNTKELKTFLNKKALMAKVYSIDTAFPGDIYSEHFCEMMSLEDAIIEDKDISYNIGDVEITYDYI
jgi:hypothetical protein